MEPNNLETRARLERQLLFKPCPTKEELQRWVVHFLGLDLPDCTVDESSNSNPLDFVWELYKQAVYDNDPDFDRILAYANRGGYKCCEKGTLILTKKGLEPIENISIGDVVWSGKAWREVLDTIHDGVKDGVKLTLTDNRTLTVSPIHRVWTWPEGEKPRWKKVSDLVPGKDLVKIGTDTPISNEGTDQTEYELGYFCGILCGDGNLTFLDRGKVAFTNKDPNVLDFWSYFCRKYAQKEPIKSRSRQYDWHVSSKKFCSFLKELGLKNHYSFEKEIPVSCFGSKSRMAGFIAGLFDTDGTVTAKGTVEFPITAQKLLRQLQVMFSCLGINAHYKLQKKYTWQNYPIGKIIVKGTEVSKLLQAGIVFKARKAKAPNFIVTDQARDLIPKKNISEILLLLPTKGGRRRGGYSRKPQTQYEFITRGKIKKLLDYGVKSGYIPTEQETYWRSVIGTPWTPVKSVEKVGTADFYDLMVDVDQSYWSNGIVSHNTLSASVIEILMVFHDQRSVVHLASVEEQSVNCLEYVKKQLRKPAFSPFITQNDARGIQITRYEGQGVYLTPKEYQALPELKKLEFQELVSMIEIVVATPQSVNGKHSSFFCLDGDTKVFIKKPGNSNRKRISRKIGRIFNKLAGLPTTGRKPVEVSEKFVETPLEDVEVLGLDFSTGTMEFRKVLMAKRAKKKVLEIKTQKRTILCTPDHKLYVLGKGYVEANRVSPGDKVITINKGWSHCTDKTNTDFIRSELNVQKAEKCDEIEQVLIGSLLGDGSVHRRKKNNAYFYEQHGLKQKNYLEWKKAILEKLFKVSYRKSARSGYTGKEQVAIYTQNSEYFNQYAGFKKDFSTFIESLGPLGLCVWYMDDGSTGGSFVLSTESFTYEQNVALKDILYRKFGIEVEVKRSKGRYWNLWGGVSAKKKMIEICYEYAHPDMLYKFDVPGSHKKCPVCGIDFWFLRQGRSPKTCGDAVCVRVSSGHLHTEEVTEKSSALKDRIVYDITVEKTHNFFANGMLVHNCLDEIDLLDSDIVYQEASGIPVESRGKYPITFLTSTRKKATGRVQAEIDDAHKNGLRVRHWNQIDLTQKCPESRHLPDEPKVVRYIDDDKLTHISEQEYEALADTEKAKLSPVEAFSGCVKNCKMLAACKTRLATNQKSTSQFLSSIPFTQNKVTKGSIEFIKSQILCRKPLSTGAIFNRFSRDKHILTAKDIYRRIEQQEPPTIFGKAELISHLLASPDIKFYGGMDFGYNHEFVAVVAAKVGIDFYIIECLAATELETTECIEYCKPLLKYRADFYPDPENPTLISSFRKARFNMLKWEKSKGSVIAGIEAVRAKLNPGPNAEPQLYLLMEDSGCGLLAEAFEKWSWKLNAAGEPTETPREEYKDRCDVVRYMILNAAPIKSKVYRPTENRKLPPKPQSISDRFWAAVKEDVHLKGVEIDPTPPDSDTPRRRKKFFY